MTIRDSVSNISTLRHLSAGVAQSQKSSEKLASGSRINRAADDAAGLAVSEKMLAMIRGDNQAISNANMGISLIRTAEGALDATHSMLHRVNELAVQASNGIYGAEERGYIQMEIDQIMSDIDRISRSTDFNGIKLLDGSLSQNTNGTQQTMLGLSPIVSNAAIVAGFADGITFSANSNTQDLFSSIRIVTDSVAGDEKVEVSGEGNSKAVTLHLATGVEYTNQSIAGLLRDAGFDYSVQMTSSRTGGNVTALFQTAGTTGAATPVTGNGLTLQIGANNAAEQRTTVNINAMDTRSLGLSGVNVTTAQGALDSIGMVKGAINSVSAQRASLGAMENRLEHTVNSLTAKNENALASLSQIRDADMAAEVINYTAANLVKQAAMAMLAQTNQRDYLVLQLLK